MKRQERHHLKENELAQGLATAREFLEPRAGQVKTIAIGVAAIVLVLLAVVLVRQRSASKAEQALAEAMVALNAPVVPTSDRESADLPAAAQLGATGSFATEKAKLQAAVPKLRAAADAYPDKAQGLTARYHLAGALAALGQNADAAKEFDVVAQKASADTFYGRMARLGRADALARSGQLDQAITSWKELADKKDDTLPADAILFSLGRAYVAKGNKEEARKTFTELVDQHPQSPYLTEAKTELENLKG